jgi:perosamine synthetase
MRLLRDHGMRPERRYWHEAVGFNFRMTNIQAAIGLAQLERLDDLLAMRRAVDETYRSLLSGLNGLSFPPALARRSAPVVWFSCITVPAARRAGLIEDCRKAGIDLRPFFNSLSAMPAFAPYASSCPASQALAATGLNLPTSRRVTAATAARVAAVIRKGLG